jgi:hypothetical protein
VPGLGYIDGNSGGDVNQNFCFEKLEKVCIDKPVDEARLAR